MFTDNFLLEVPRKFKDDFSIEEIYKNVKNDTILNHSNPDFGGINSEENINSTTFSKAISERYLSYALSTITSRS